LLQDPAPSDSSASEIVHTELVVRRCYRTSYLGGCNSAVKEIKWEAELAAWRVDMSGWCVELRPCCRNAPTRGRVQTGYDDNDATSPLASTPARQL